MRHRLTASSRMLALTLLAGALIAGCTKSSGTYVLVRFEGSTTPGIPIATIRLSASLASNQATTTFSASTEAGITLPSTGYLEIGAGEGDLVLLATAEAGNSALIGEGEASGKITRDKTTTMVIKFLPPKNSADAGSPSDGATKDAQIGLDLGLPDRGVDKPILPGSGGIIAGTGGVIGPGGVIASGGASVDAAPVQGGAVGMARIVSAPEAVTFGPTAVGMGAGAQTITLTNQGTAPTGTVRVISQDPNQFPIVSNTCIGLSLQPGASCTLSVAFKPAVSSLVASVLSIEAPASGSLKIPLAGQGADSVSSLELMPPMADFGVLDIALGGGTAVFTVKNTGSGPSGSLAVAFGAPSPVFQITADGCAGTSLNPGTTCNFSVAFKPSSPGQASTSVSVRGGANALASSSVKGAGKTVAVVTVQLAGTGKGSVQAPGMTCAGGVCKTTIDITDAAMLPNLALQAVPDTGSTFAGYTGGTCGATPSCGLIVSGNVSLTARFQSGQVQFGLNVIGLASHQGTLVLTDGSFSCTQSCGPLARQAGEVITINAKPTSGSTFAGWTEGPCKGTNPTCTFTLNSDTFVTATFGPQNYMFTSSSLVVPGALGGVAGADTECQRLANKASLPGTYKAWLSTTTVAANTRVGKGGWIRTDGRPFTTGAAALADPVKPTVFYPPRMDETGQDLGFKRTPVLTGSTLLGNSTTEDCAGYTSQTGSVMLGTANAGAVYWTNEMQGDCANRFRLYCFRSDLGETVTIPPVLPGKRLFVTKEFFVPTGGRSQADSLCQQEATAANLSGTFIAFLSTSEGAAIDRLQPGRWKRTDHVFVANSINDFVGGGLMASVGLSANQSWHLTGMIWTGALTAGTRGALETTCQDFRSSVSPNVGFAGLTHTTDPTTWFGYNKHNCSSPNTWLLCIEP